MNEYWLGWFLGFFWWQGKNRWDGKRVDPGIKLNCTWTMFWEEE
jgi:hypothetical protein